MRFLFDSADEYLKNCDWKDLALVKFCLFAMGLMVGGVLPEKAKKPALLTGAAVFVATYIPLMLKYGKIVARLLKQPEPDEE